jgi:membrane protease YdiL (CAAX protease family)
VGFTWISLMLAPPLIAAWLPTTPASDLALVLVASVVLTRAPALGRPTGQTLARTAASAIGGLAGVASYPAWILLIAGAGAALGLQPAAPIGPRSLGWFESGTLMVLAPLVEEKLYRQILQGALDRRLGPALAIPIASTVFAASHLDPWPMLASLMLGLVAGALARASRGIPLSFGLHAGLNLAGLRLGVPVFGRAIDPFPGVVAATFLLCIGVILLRAMPSSDSR